VDAGAEIFAQLFGDFQSADPSLMRGVVAVPLADLGRELERAEVRAEAARAGAAGAAGARASDGGAKPWTLNPCTLHPAPCTLSANP